MSLLNSRQLWIVSVNAGPLRQSLFSIVCVICLTNCSIGQTLAAGPADDVDFNRDIRPILSNHCFQCHGPDEDSREAELRLDSHRAATARHDGDAAIVAGDVEHSVVVQRVTSTDEDVVMPPPEFGKPLTNEQIELLKRWIDGGAEYAKHWSFEPVRRPKLPAIKVNSPLRNAVDHFVVQKLGRAGFDAAPQADRYTLVRRVYLDLLGLPPSIDEVDRFVHDKNDDAYDRLLDQVLASPHFGERWGRHWLDQARYADSHGYTVDNERTMWPYRDWVINAFNQDMPFDQFTIEQLAGDLLPNAELSQKVATGFHRNTLINTEGGAKPDQFRDEQVKDRTDTTGLVWMGLTVGCAKCHTHKFDPITQHEYYQLYAFFNSTADRNSVSPTLRVPTAKQTELIASLEDQIEELKKRLADDVGRAERRQAWDQWLQSRAASEETGVVGWNVLRLSGTSTAGTELIAQADQSLLAKGAMGAPGDFRVTAASPVDEIRSVRLEVLVDESLPKKGPGRAGNGNFVLSEFQLLDEAGKPLTFLSATAVHSQPGYSIEKAIDGVVTTGWAINGAPEGSMNRNRSAWFVLPEAFSLKPGQPLNLVLKFHQAKYDIGRFRISVSSGKWINESQQQELFDVASIAPAKRSREQGKQLTAAFIDQDAELAPLQASLDKASAELTAIRKAVPATMILQELAEPRTTHLQVRGEFLRIGDEVPAATPAVLPALPPKNSPHNRLDFAKWLTHPDHPLTARVRVNRIWMRLFGRGLVETENDFGIQGTLPTHPELLNWLASEFVEEGWSQKSLIRMIMMSATYRQSSKMRPELNTVDARNLLLGRQNRIRVEAEIVRDVALSVSGRLAAKIGGPSVYPPQEAGIYAFTQSKKNWRTSKGDDRFRRGLYTYFYRSAQYPMLATFDVPKFNATCTQRDRSNTPLQSLTVANSEAMFELAGAFGERIVANGGDDDQSRMEYAFRLCFARPPLQQELAGIAKYLQKSRERFTDEAKAWTAVARLLMNLDEFITRE